MFFKQQTNNENNEFGNKRPKKARLRDGAGRNIRENPSVDRAELRLFFGRNFVEAVTAMRAEFPVFGHLFGRFCPSWHRVVFMAFGLQNRLHLVRIDQADRSTGQNVDIFDLHFALFDEAADFHFVGSAELGGLC